MKKIFTFFVAAILTSSVFAAGHKPEVTLRSARNYEVIIDGKSYFTNNNTIMLQNIRAGQHSVKVYEANSNPFRKFKKLVSASSFQVRNTDVNINVDYRGQVSITEERYGRDRDNDRRDVHGFNQPRGNSHEGSYGSNDKNRRF
jgi:hypothetical protein